MRARVLSIAGCPHQALAVSRLQEAADRLGVDLVVEEQLVTGAEQAARLGFAGSPSIQLEGVDPFSATPVAALACRVYPTPEGLQGAPSVDQLVAALAAGRR